MRVLLLLAVLVGAVGVARQIAHSRYPMEEVKVPGTKQPFRLYQAPDQCWEGKCYLSVVFLTKGTSRAVWRAEAEGLEPWLAAQARSRGQRGAMLLAIRPGFAYLFPPTKVRWFAFGGRGSRWKILDEGDGSETKGITE